MDPSNTSDILKEHNIPIVDVDWFIRSKEQLNPEDTPSPTQLESHEPTKGNDVNQIYRRNSIAASSIHNHELLKKVANDTNNTTSTDRKKIDESEVNTSFQPKRTSPEASISSTVPLRRTKSASIVDLNSSESRRKQYAKSNPPEKKVGFFKGLFGRRKSISQASGSPMVNTQISQNSSLVTNNNNNKPNLGGPSIPVQSPKRSPVKVATSPLGSNTDVSDINLNAVENPTLPGPRIPLVRSKTESELDNAQHQHHHHRHDSTVTETIHEECPYSLHESASDLDLDDRRLLEFLQFYKSKGSSMSAFKDPRISNCNSIRHARTRASFSIGTKNEQSQQPPREKIIDVKGRQIPAHPIKSKLPSAFKESTRKFLPSGEDPYQLLSTQGNSSKKFGAFLRRVTSYNSSNNNVADSNTVAESTSSISISETDRTFDPAKVTVLPGLEELKPLNHVSFATNTYYNDPPQQICSKNPRKGEVEVKSNGSVVIHRLTPQEKRKILQETTTGIVVGGTGQLKLLSPQTDDGSDTDDGDGDNNDLKKQEEKIPEKVISVKSETIDDESSSQRRNIELAAAEAAAEARAKETPNDLTRTVTNHEEEVSVSRIASHLTIDKPMVSRRSSSNLLLSSTSLNNMSTSESVATSGDEEVFPPKNMKIPHDVVYTRCCHLREILPIPATLKQLKAGSTDPIPLLQLRNPCPSMVEIWSFSDFISIAPILCLSLDGVNLNVDMLRIILGSVVNKEHFEKLSLRNTPLDAEGWKVLSYFVSHSKSLVSLDLTMVPHIKVNVQKPSKSSLKSTVQRMESNNDSRSDMNWNLLAGAIALKGGLEEIILSGAKMPENQFKMFMEVGCMNTSRLGLAYNELTLEQCKVLASWIVESRVTGLDIGFNDLNGKLQPFCDAMSDKIHGEDIPNLIKYVSLNNTNLEVQKGGRSDNNEFLKLISILCYSKNLKFLDISNNPKIFPNCMNTIADCLPVFANLVRLHIDFENLNTTEIVIFAEMIPLCLSLHHVSMLGTPLDLASCKALAEAVKKSSSLITLDIDYVYMPEKIKDEISLYSMRNIQNELTNPTKSETEGNEFKKLSYDKKSRESLQNIRDEFTALLTETFTNKNTDEYNEMVESFIVKVTKARTSIRKVVQDLFNLRMQGELNLEGKEALIRLCFIDASLEKSIRLLKQRHSHSAQDSNRSSTTDLPATNSSDEQLERKPSNSQVSGMLTSSSFSKSGHTVLLPFGSILPEKSFNNSADDTVEFRDDTIPERLIDPESIKNKPIDEQLDDTVDDNEPVDITFSSPLVDKEAVSRAAESSDSDQIKEFLLKKDVNAVVNVIDELHSQGYHFHHIFRKQCPKQNKDIASTSSITVSENADGNKSNPSGKENNASVESNEVDEKLGNEVPSTPDELDEYLDTKEDEAMNHAYDEVLDRLQKVRVVDDNIK